MNKALVIARSFEFARSPTGIIERDFFERLPKDKYALSIFCSALGTSGISAVGDIFRYHDRRIYRLFSAAFRRLGIPDFANLPDATYLEWGLPVRRQILRHLRTHPADYLHSISMPCSCQLVALQVKRKTGLPWIAQFYDPWIDNPFREFAFQFLKRRDEALERTIAETADVIIHDNDMIAKVWRTRYGPEIAKKIHVIPLIFDTSKLPPVALRRKPDGSLTISHIGNFYLSRNSRHFVEAVALFLQRHPELASRIKINYIGNVTSADTLAIKENQLQSIFNLVGPLREDACYPYYQESDLFLTIDSMEQANYFFPSKLLKYFYFSKPILGLTPSTSVTHSELRNSGHTCLDGNDIPKIADFIETAFFHYDSLLHFDKKYHHRFSPDHVISAYDALVDELLAR